MRHIAVDKLRRVPSDAPLKEGIPVYCYGGDLGDQYTEPSLLVTFPGRYLSDGVQQVEVCGRKEGHPLANDRHTLDHRAQIPDAGVPTLHHTRLYRQSHLLAARRHMARWAGVHGHVGGVEACCKVLGIGRHPPPYGDWPVDLQASTEVCHCVHLGIGMRTAELELHCITAQDQPLVCLVALAGLNQCAWITPWHFRCENWGEFATSVAISGAAGAADAVSGGRGASPRGWR